MEATTPKKKMLYVSEEDVALDDYIPIPTLIALLQQHQQAGKTHFYVTDKTDRCGERDGYEMEFIEQREETDEEYNRRLEKERLEKEAADRRKEEIATAQKESRRKEFLKLKEEFEPDQK